MVCNKAGDLADTLQKMKVKVLVQRLHPWRKIIMIIFRYLYAWKLHRLTRKLGIRLIHCCDLWLGGYAFRLAGQLKVPLILHVRRPLSPRDIGKFNCSAAARLVPISKRIRENLLIAGIPAEKIMQIDDSVDTQLFSAQYAANILRREYSPIGEILIGIVGRIDAFKRQLDFLKAAVIVLRRCSRPVTFFVIGEVHSRHYFHKMQRFIRENDIDRHVIFTDRREDMPAVISSLDILVTLSGGSVMFEAMAAGKAVVSAGFTTKKFACHLQDGVTGLLIESQQPADLADALIKLIENPRLREHLGINARQWALKELTHTKMAAKTQQLYDTLLGKYK